MPKLIYLDLLQMVTPGEQLDSSLFDFYVFGSFDALKVEQEIEIPAGSNQSRDINSLQELHAISKKRRINVPVRFDKQSIHLYAADENASDIFRIDNEYASQPLVLTLIQLDDYSINQNTPADLVDEFKKELQKLQDSDELKKVSFEVFFCLGEPDIVAVFRYSSLTEIARLIYRLRLLTFSTNGDKGDGICVLSTSSHCAFPSAPNQEILKDNVGNWTLSDTDIRFVTLFDTSYGLDDNTKKDDILSEQTFLFDRMLLGDWDYIREWNNNNAKELLSNFILDSVVHFDKDKTGSFKSSWSIPVIKLTDKDSKYAHSNRKLSSIQTTDILSNYEGSNTAFSDLADKIKKLLDIYGSAEVTNDLSEKVVAMHSTLIGILKHLCQLRDGRFQYDLYAFVRPAFDALPKITKNICDLIDRIQKEYDKQEEDVRIELKNARDETISGLLDTYIHDTSRLLTELQHLFSVLSISPHTYMESYGSNMRSITATCKLLVAYQGIAYSLSKNFDMTMIKDGTETVNANEVMLVIPYRRIHQNTRVLFEDTSPENRIVYIRINASDMFRVQKTLFMLLHECGHHILSRDFRENRIKYYFDAYSGYLLDSAFSSIFREPFTSLQMPWIDVKVPDDKIASQKEINIECIKEDEVCEMLIQTIQENQKLGDKLLSYWETDYKNMSRQKVIAEPIALDNNFLYYVQEAVCYYMAMKLKKFEEADSDDVYTEDDFGLAISKIFDEVILHLFSEIIDTEYNNRIYNNDNELWHLAEYRTIYKAFPDEIKLKTVKTICHDTFRSIYKETASELKTIFSDIYSDIFAIAVLGIGELPEEEKKKEAEKYLILLKDEASFRLKQNFSNTYLLIRIFAVLEGGMKLAITEIYKIMASVLSMPQSDIMALYTGTINRIGYRYVLKYTKDLCVPCISDQITQSEKLKTDTEKLQAMYRSVENQQGLNSVMDAVYYFWKSSTQRD